MIDFDGRSSLHDVHETMRETMHETLSTGDDDHLYAFFLSGQYWDKSSEYVDPRTGGRRADQALLFRLRLRAGQRFAYVYDFGTEHRYQLSVVSVTEVDAELPRPLLIESVGQAPALYEQTSFDEVEPGDQEDYGQPDPALAEPLGLATRIVELQHALDALEEDEESAATRRPALELGEATLALLLAIDGDLPLLSKVDRELDFELLEIMLNVPECLRAADESALSVRVAEALKFCAPDEMNGEIALSYAEAGNRERALSVVLTSLETAVEPFVAEKKAGDVYRALGEADAAEAYYRRALAIAVTPSDRAEAMMCVASLMIDTGRESEATAFISQQRAATSAPAKTGATPSVGRNEPCPCGSGKKYKKCHGA